MNIILFHLIHFVPVKCLLDIYILLLLYIYYYYTYIYSYIFINNIIYVWKIVNNLYIYMYMFIYIYIHNIYVSKIKPHNFKQYKQHIAQTC